MRVGRGHDVRHSAGAVRGVSIEMLVLQGKLRLWAHRSASESCFCLGTTPRSSNLSLGICLCDDRWPHLGFRQAGIHNGPYLENDAGVKELDKLRTVFHQICEEKSICQVTPLGRGWFPKPTPTLPSPMPLPLCKKVNTMLSCWQVKRDCDETYETNTTEPCRRELGSHPIKKSAHPDSMHKNAFVGERTRRRPQGTRGHTVGYSHITSALRGGEAGQSLSKGREVAWIWYWQGEGGDPKSQKYSRRHMYMSPNSATSCSRLSWASTLEWHQHKDHVLHMEAIWPLYMGYNVGLICNKRLQSDRQ